MWKDFFYFTKTERQGIIVLVVLIIGAFSAPRLFQLFIPAEENNLEKEENFEKEYEEFMASLKEVKYSSKYTKKLPLPHPKREIKLSTFDPNTADSITFLTLGLPSWMAKNILHYREKQGKFSHPEDFRKIYGLTEEQYQMLLPYIHITQKITPKDTTQLLMVQKVQRDTLFKYQPGTIIDLNQADTTELKKIPGIGSGIARMIVNYRNRLGAFYRIEQLQDIHLKVEKLRPWFSIDTTLIRCININKASTEQMMRHPYINYYQAKVINEHRKKKGPLKSLKELTLYEEFTPADFERLSPYICMN
ncbi:helix-hairpin-helix domain-containing protein [Bacteroides sp.]|uniref:ComEA family DNA-binding protein n=1 Tax=Bacteroides sp. TaxID=29523 RepID=UPI0026113A9E|nr:helix-hairpin-helix domain-containing protein [Bacteroides sp.]MDD3038471.1 helix-hairpin-helix domain-containing protein [Bacteroides sp.]